jgi:hypothetical protein
MAAIGWKLLSSGRIVFADGAAVKAAWFGQANEAKTRSRGDVTMVDGSATPTSTLSSWPALCGPSTCFPVLKSGQTKKDVDGPDKPGHDELCERV